LLAFAIVQVAFAEKKPMQDEIVYPKEAEVAEELSLQADPEGDKIRDSSHEDNFVPKRRSRCSRRFTTKQLKAILTRRTTYLRSLGVRVVNVPRNMQRKLRRFRKVTVRRRLRIRPTTEVCQERKGVVTYTSANYANANLAYRSQGVECVGRSCRINLGVGISLMLGGKCVLRKTLVVVPIFNGCRFSSKTIEIGCACKCVK
jgi:hypothetical protein